MTGDYTADQYDAEYAQFLRRPDWELRNVARALNSLPFLNTSREWARLAAVRTIQRERRRR